MPDNKTQLQSQRVINDTLRTQPAANQGARPFGVWVGLFTVTPTETTPGTEVIGTNYARQQVAQLDANWSDPAIGVEAQTTSNLTPVEFPEAGAGGWGNVTGVALLDHATDPAALTNELYFVDIIGGPKAVADGDTVTLAAGDIVLAEK